MSGGEDTTGDGTTLKILWSSNTPLPLGTIVDFDFLVEGTGKIVFTFHHGIMGTYSFINFVDIKQPTWTSSLSDIVDDNRAQTAAGYSKIYIRFENSAKINLYRLRVSLNGTFYREATISELQTAWTNSQSYTEKKTNYYPVWEYYGRERILGALPAVTNLAGPTHRKCNYNIDFQGKNIKLLVDDAADSSISTDGDGSFNNVTIDCGLEDIKAGASLSRMKWLDFPRRGFIMASGEGSGTVVGKGIVVQHCATNAWSYANFRSHPGPGLLSKQIDWGAGGGVLVVSDSTKLDGPVLDGVTIRECSAEAARNALRRFLGGSAEAPRRTWVLCEGLLSAL